MGYALTDEGTDEALRVGTTRRSEEAAVLEFIYEMTNDDHDSVSIDEIMAHTNMHEEKAAKVLRHLQNLGLIEQK